MNLPFEFRERMREMLGAEYDAFLASYDDTVQNRGIRLNRLKDVRVPESLERVPWCTDGYYLPEGSPLCGSHPYHAAGAFYFQEPSAMSAAEGLPLAQGFRVLDLCAAPGGKTTQLAARMGNRGLLVSNEIIPKRAAILAENVERMGCANTIVTNESPQRLAAKFPEYFDAVLVDAPCSGEGMFRKEPAAAAAWSEAHTHSCAVRQKNIVDDAYKTLRSGGYLMYSTCTFSIEENEGVVVYLAEKYGMEIERISELSMLSSGIGDFEGIDRCRRIFPHRSRGEGHFAALLRKSGDGCRIENPKPKGSRRKKAISRELASAVRLYREFEGETLTRRLEGEFILFGDNLLLMSERFDISSLKVTRCGLKLGELRRGRFEPAHALAHALPSDAFVNVVNLPVESDTLKRYMRGEEIPAENVRGFTAVCCDGLPIGWGKASGGVVKNKYPKSLRLKA